MKKHILNIMASKYILKCYHTYEGLSTGSVTAISGIQLMSLENI